MPETSLYMSDFRKNQTQVNSKATLAAITKITSRWSLMASFGLSQLVSADLGRNRLDF